MSAAVLFAGQTPVAWVAWRPLNDKARAGSLWPGRRSAPPINVHASMTRLRTCPRAALPSPEIFLVPAVAVAALAMQLRSDESTVSKKQLQQPRAPARDWRAKLGQFQVVALPGKGLSFLGGATRNYHFERTVVPEDPWAQATRSNFSPPVPSAPPAASTTQWSSSGGWAQQWGWPGRDYGHRGDYADPPAWPGWSYRKQWTAAVRRWDKNTDVPVWKRADKVLRSLGWDLQTSFEHLTEAQLTTDKYLESILSIIELKAGVREDDERRFAFRIIMYDGGRG
eukprot:s907_g11.t1